MSTAPKPKSKLSCNSLKLKTETKKESDFSVMNTPVNKKSIAPDGGDDYSPVYFPLTQETSDDIDVLWDWHSPQTSQRKRKKIKRTIPVHSPKFPIKRHSSENQSQNFEWLRNELKALQEELACPDDEDSLCLSPQQEHEFKAGVSNSLGLGQEPEPPCDDDLFNDSLDDHLVFCSQQVENELMGRDEGPQSIEKKEIPATVTYDNMEVDNLINKYSKKNIEPKTSFDTTLNFSNLGNFSYKMETPKHSKFIRTLSENVIETGSGKLELHRTKSFELAGFNEQNNLLEEIERKRLEAKAKLEAKRRKENTMTQSPSKCSPEEIEKKRLQALAKREARRLQEIVEKKRQEALKKLQNSRMKNACQVKSTLSKRL